MTPPSPNIAALGLGCVTFGREIGREESFAMMDHALAHGMTFFDTAAAYGGGASERIVGDWLAQRRDARSAVTLATKLLPPYSAAGLEDALRASLLRLGVANVDVLFLHQWHESAATDATLRTLDGFVRSGRVRRLAASNFSASQIDRVCERQAQLGLAPFTALQTIHNLAVRGVDADLRAVCARREISIITYSPLGAGFLTGKHAAGVVGGTRFELIPGHQNIYFNPLARERLARLTELSTQAGVPMIPLALAWALRQPQIDTVLVGGRTTAHLDQALRARDFSAPEILTALETT